MDAVGNDLNIDATARGFELAIADEADLDGKRAAVLGDGVLGLKRIDAIGLPVADDGVRASGGGRRGRAADAVERVVVGGLELRATDHPSQFSVGEKLEGKLVIAWSENRLIEHAVEGQLAGLLTDVLAVPSDVLVGLEDGELDVVASDVLANRHIHPHEPRLGGIVPIAGEVVRGHRDRRLRRDRFGRTEARIDGAVTEGVADREDDEIAALSFGADAGDQELTIGGDGHAVVVAARFRFLQWPQAWPFPDRGPVGSEGGERVGVGDGEKAEDIWQRLEVAPEAEVVHRSREKSRNAAGEERFLIGSERDLIHAERVRRDRDAAIVGEAPDADPITAQGRSESAARRDGNRPDP